MDPLDRAFHEEQAYIARCADPSALLDRMAAYREDRRAAVARGLVKARLRCDDLLELAEDRVAELKALAARQAQAGRAPARVAQDRSADRSARHSDDAVMRERAPDPRVVAELERLREARRAAELERRAAEERAQRAEAEADAQRAELERLAAQQRAARAEAEARARRAELERIAAARQAAQERAAATEGEQVVDTEPVAPELEVRAAPPLDRKPQSFGAPLPAQSIAPTPRPTPKAPTPPTSPAPLREATSPCVAPAPSVSAEQETAVPLSHKGEDLVRYRSTHGLTQRAAAQRLGVSHGTVAKAEREPDKPLGEALQTGLRRVLAS